MFLSQGFISLKLAFNLLCGQGWPWTGDPTWKALDAYAPVPPLKIGQHLVYRTLVILCSTKKTHPKDTEDVLMKHGKKQQLFLEISEDTSLPQDAAK